jgi:hypothetical protein
MTTLTIERKIRFEIQDPNMPYIIEPVFIPRHQELPRKMDLEPEVKH